MRGRLSTCLSIFAVMALSNAVVPLLPSYGGGGAVRGLIYAAYFFGAFALTLPSGILSDRFGTGTMMRSGLGITIPAGVILWISSDPLLVIAARLIEGIGAGLFVPAAMAYINSLRDHEVMSGYYMASLNAGLVIGLVLSGFLAVYLPGITGIAVFAAACVLAFLLRFSRKDNGPTLKETDRHATLLSLVAKDRYLWYSAIVLIGITGVVTSLYPAFSPLGPDIDSLWIAAMTVGTILSSLAISRMALPPIPALRMSGIVMAGGVFLLLFSPAGFLIIGAAAGVAMIAQMGFLAHAGADQGIMMGLYSTTSYFGMGLLPALSGVIADKGGYFITFCIFSLAALSVAVTIGRCRCEAEAAAAGTG